MNNSFAIGNKMIGLGYPVFVIAEIGVNHNGSVDIARRMIDAAVEAGADAVKVQIITAGKSYTRLHPSYEIFREMELKPLEWDSLIRYAEERGVRFISTFVNVTDLSYATRYSLPAIKVSSTNVTNFPLLKAIAKERVPVILSTGMSYLSEVDEAVRFLQSNDVTEVAILHCTSEYPTPASEVNLNAMRTLGTSFPHSVIGFSDHTRGVECAVAAVAMGARILEKHYTLDRGMEGPDHHFSSTPDELKRLVQSVHNVEKAFGNPRKLPTANELLMRKTYQRSITAACDISKGEKISLDMIAVKRAHSPGILPRDIDVVVGRVSRCDIPEDEVITWEKI